jgi:hypothetical protein
MPTDCLEAKKSTLFAKAPPNQNRESDVRWNRLHLVGLLAMLAAPLSAGAGTVLPDRQESTAVPSIMQEDFCGSGRHWEKAGYFKHGKWRPAHCAPREMAY